MGGLEEKIYRRQVYKKAMNLSTIETAEKGEEGSGEKAFSKYFNDSDLFALFQYNDSDECETLDLIMSKDGFAYEKTPTNTSHIEDFLNKNSAVKGITLNSNLYTGQAKDDVDENKYTSRENLETNSSTKPETNGSGNII